MRSRLHAVKLELIYLQNHGLFKETYVFIFVRHEDTYWQMNIEIFEDLELSALWAMSVVTKSSLLLGAYLKTSKPKLLLLRLPFVDFVGCFTCATPAGESINFSGDDPRLPTERTSAKTIANVTSNPFSYGRQRQTRSQTPPHSSQPYVS